MTPVAANRRRVAIALAFLAPNILGFLAFTLVPLVFSLAMAFTNWDLKLHNIFHANTHVHFIGMANFQQMLGLPDFWRYLGNTLFFMIGMPFGIAASLVAALLLSKELYPGGHRMRIAFFASALLIVSCLLLTAVGAGATGMTLMLVAVIGGTLLLGAGGGGTVYRTLLYLPNFTSGVATFLLWKKLFNSHTGPINLSLNKPLAMLGDAVNHSPSWLVGGGGVTLCATIALLLALFAVWRIWKSVHDGDFGAASALGAVILLAIPIAAALCQDWNMLPSATRIAMNATTAIGVVVAIGIAWSILLVTARRGSLPAHSPAEGMGTALMFASTIMTALFILIGLAMVCQDLPAMARAGLDPPGWLDQYNWAKPAIMLMGFWGAIGSNTMLLYLAALTNVPQDLYEAADIDGASRFSKFWNVTWPQLAPTTFFIVVMGVIGGLQGGFDTAKVMTNGGPAGATTTLAYYIYSEGFETGRLGFSSAVAWMMFLLVLIITLFNWKVGNKYVND